MTSPNARTVSGVPIAQVSGSASSAVSFRTAGSSDSTAIATTASRSPQRDFSVPSHASEPRQGGHHVAQSSTTTARPARSARATDCPARSENGASGRLATGTAFAGEATERAASLRPARMSSIIRDRSARNRSWLAALRNGM